MIGILLVICCALTAYTIYLESKIELLKKSNQYLNDMVDKIIDKYNELVTHINNMSDILLTFKKDDKQH